MHIAVVIRLSVIAYATTACSSFSGTSSGGKQQDHEEQPAEIEVITDRTWSGTSRQSNPNADPNANPTYDENHDTSFISEQASGTLSGDGSKSEEPKPAYERVKLYMYQGNDGFNRFYYYEDVPPGHENFTKYPDVYFEVFKKPVDLPSCKAVGLYLCEGKPAVFNTQTAGYFLGLDTECGGTGYLKGTDPLGYGCALQAPGTIGLAMAYHTVGSINGIEWYQTTRPDFIANLRNTGWTVVPAPTVYLPDGDHFDEENNQ